MLTFAVELLDSAMPYYLKRFLTTPECKLWILMFVIIMATVQCKADPSPTDTLPFKIEFACNDRYCDITASGPTFELRGPGSEFEPSQLKAMSGQKLLYNVRVLPSDNRIILACDYGTNIERDVYFVSIEGDKIVSHTKVHLSNLVFQQLTRGKDDTYYATLEPQDFRQVCKINDIVVSKSLLNDNTFLSFSGNSFLIKDTTRTSHRFKWNSSSNVHGSTLSVYTNGVLANIRPDTMGHSHVIVDTPNVFSVNETTIKTDKKELITYDMSTKELVRISIPGKGMMDHQLLSNTDTGMYISANYTDIMQVRDKRCRAMRNDLIYYDKKAKTSATIFSMKYMPTTYVVKKKDMSYSWQVCRGSILQQHNDYLVYSIFGIDTTANATNGDTKFTTVKDSVTGETDTLYNAFNYNSHLTTNAVISKRTRQVICTRYAPGFGVLKNRNVPCSSKEIWKLDEQIGPKRIDLVHYSNNTVITLMSDPYSNEYPQKFIYRVYRKHAKP